MSSWKCCRMCLGVDSLHPIFAKSKFYDKYTQIILSTTGIRVEPTDSLPQDICKRCVYFVNNTHTFRKKCDENQKILLKRLNDETVKGIKSESVIVKSEITDNFIDISDLVDEVIEDEKIDKTEINNKDLIDDKVKANEKYEVNDDKYENNDFNDSMDNNDFEDESKSAECVDKPIEVRVSKRRPEIPVIQPMRSQKSSGEIQERVREDIECEYCHKILTSKLSLRNHYKIHTGFDVVCEHCGKKFITKRLLLMHCRAKHGYEKTDKCSYCDYRASNAEQVKIHERLHTGEKPYVCSSCGAGFHRKSSYLQHVAIHLPEKNVQCDLCHARFKSVTLMRIHRHRHREIRYWFKCRVCENTFVRRRNVSRHLQRMHGLEPTNEHIERVKIGQ